MGTQIRVVAGDITKIAADAIVNAANSRLAGGGGVDGAIHRAGGPSLMAELALIRSEKGTCPAGQAVVTGAGNLPARWVLHAVGPVFGLAEGREAELLASCYSTCLRMAQDLGAKSISFPSISTGAYGYPICEAAKIAVKTVRDWTQRPDCTLHEVILVAFDDRTKYYLDASLAES